MQLKNGRKSRFASGKYWRFSQMEREGKSEISSICALTVNISYGIINH